MQYNENTEENYMTLKGIEMIGNIRIKWVKWHIEMLKLKNALTIRKKFWYT